MNQVSVNAAIVPAGTVQGDATAISIFTRYVHAPETSSGAGVRLPAANAGDEFVISNGGSNALKLYPPSGAAINGLGANASVSIPANGLARVFCFSPTIYSVIYERVSADTDTDKVVLSANNISSKASDAAVVRFVAPVAGTISLIQTVLNDALATANATVTTAIGATPVTDGVVTIAEASSAAGDIDSATPSAANTVSVGDLITLTVGGGSTATGTLNAQVTITRTV